MGLVTLPYANEIDYHVQFLQTRIWNLIIKPVWGMTDSTFNFYGRAERKKQPDSTNGRGGYIPMFYNPAINAYDSGFGKNSAGGMFFEDRLAGIGYFSLNDPIKRTGNCDQKSSVSLMFFLLLNKITPDGIQNAQNQRLDEICVNDIRNFIQFNGCGFTPIAVYKDIDKVLEKFTGQIKHEQLNQDMHPKFCFRIDLELPYDPGQTQNSIIAFQNNPMDITLIFFIKTTPDPTKVISVGNGVSVYQEYAPTNILTVVRVDNGKAYLKGLNVSGVILNNTPDTLTTMISRNSSGAYDRTGQGDPFGLNNGDFIAITFTNVT